MESLLGSIGPVLLTLLSGVASWAIAVGTKLLKAKAGNDLVSKGLGVVADIADAVVCDLESGLVKKAKALAADGKLSDSDISKIRHEAEAMVLDRLPKETMSVLTKQGVTISGIIQSAVERAVANRKQAGGKE